MERGIKVLSQPATISVDLVFIHGLLGDRIKTWASQGSSQSWPQALLPHDFPNARILSWGYDSSVSHSISSRDSITGHSLDLLSDLRSLRDHTETENVELVFVCHSLGGIICKQLLIDSKNAPDIRARAIYDLTVGIIFLGTPHAPLHLPNSIRAILKATVIDGNSTLFRQLLSRSDEVGRLHESFQSLLQGKNQYGRPITIVSFAEAGGTLMGPLVSEKSAVLRGQRPSLLPGDHHSMVKFGTPTDPGYEKFCLALAEVVENSKPPPKVPQEMSSQLIGRCLKSLSYPELQIGEAAVPLASPDTCHWIYDHVNYQRWYLDDVNDGSESLLWIKGTPGSGKSTLMKHMIMKLRENRSYCLSFFFSRRRSHLQGSLAGCYRSLLCQMLEQLPEYSEKLIRNFQEKEKSNAGVAKSIQWSLFELSQIFHATIRDVPVEEKIYIFIDGLDEFKYDELRLLVKWFLDSSESSMRQGKRVKLCFSSRHYPYIAVRDHLEVIIESSIRESDIEKYLIATLPREYRSDAAKIARRSGGNFLWTTLVVNQLHQNNTSLDEIPLELEDMYLYRLSASQNIWSRDDITLVQCILSASRPLDTSILCNVLGLDLDKFSQFEDHLIFVSANLFEVDSNRFIQPIHTTVRELFLRPQALDIIGYHHSPDDFLRHGHRLLLSFCLDTLAAVDSSNDVSHSSVRPIFAMDESDMNELGKHGKVQTVMSDAEEYAIWHTFEHLLHSDLLGSTPERLAEHSISKDRLHRALLGWSLLFEQQSVGRDEQGHLLYESVLKVVGEYPTWFDLLPEDIRFVRMHVRAKSRADAVPEVHSQYSDLNSLRKTSAKEFLAINEGSEVKSNFAFVDIYAMWQVAGFIHENFPPKQKIGDIFVIVGQPQNAQGLTCGEYVGCRWPGIGQAILNLLDKLRPDVKHPRTESSQDSISPDTEIDIEGLELRMMNWQGPDKLGELELASFHSRGPIERLLDFIEILAWLSAALRHAKADVEGLMESDIHAELLRQDGEPTLSCNLLPWFLKRAVKSHTSCWHDLFKRTVIVNSPRIRQEANQVIAFLQKLLPWFAASDAPAGAGLEVNMDRMVALASAETLVNYEGGLVFLGYSTILVPVRWLDSGALQWHLLTEEGGKRIALWRIDEEIPKRVLIADAKTLRNTRLHLLALWPRAKIVLGTKRMENAHLRRAEVGEKKFSILLQSLSLGFGSGGLGYAGPTLGATVAFAKTQTQYDPEKQKNPDLLIDFKKEPILLYDPDPAERRAWLVPKLSVLLQMVHLYISTKGLSYNPPCALEQANGGESAWKALEGHGDDEIASIGELEDNKLRLSDLLKRISVNLRRMEKKPLHNGLCDRVIGYDFADLVSKPDVRLRKTEYAWTSNRQGWYFFTTRLPVLICRDLGDVILPIAAEGAQPLRRFETGRDQLAAPIRCLQAICEDGGGDLTVGKLDSHWVWHSPHTPFGDCHCLESTGGEHARLPGCDITQYVFPSHHHHSRQWAGASVNQDGVILVGRFTGKRLQKVARDQSQRGPGHGRVPIRREVDPIEADAVDALNHAADLPRENERNAKPQHPHPVPPPPPPPPPLAADNTPEADNIPAAHEATAPGGRQNDLADANPPIPPEHNIQANGDIAPMIGAAAPAANDNGLATEEADTDDNPAVPILVPVLLGSGWDVFFVWLKTIWKESLRKHLGLYILLVILVWNIWG